MLSLLIGDPSHIETSIQLAAFAEASLAAVAALIVRHQKGKLPYATLWMIAILVPPCAAILGPLLIVPLKPTYHIRVTLVDSRGIPVDGTAWSSLGGEPKKASRGWEIDIPRDSRPGDGKAIIYGQSSDKSLNGETPVTLADEHSISVQVVLLSIPPDPAYHIRVTLLNLQGIPVDGTAWSSLGGEPKKEGRGWEIDILRDSVPSNGKAIIYGRSADRSLNGETPVTLADDLSISVPVVLLKPTYHIRVTLLDLGGNPVHGTASSSLGGEVKKAKVGWEIDIPGDGVPSNGKAIIYGQSVDKSLTGEKTVTLAHDHKISVEVVLQGPGDNTPPPLPPTLVLGVETAGSQLVQQLLTAVANCAPAALNVRVNSVSKDAPHDVLLGCRGSCPDQDPRNVDLQLMRNDGTKLWGYSVVLNGPVAIVAGKVCHGFGSLGDSRKSILNGFKGKGIAQ
jgi:hypothetical protein